MRKRLTLFTLLLCCTLLCAQDKHVHKDLAKHQTIEASDFLGDSGFVLEIGGSASTADNSLMFFNAQGELLWEKPMEYKNSQTNKALASSPTGDIVYAIASKDYTEKPHYVNQVRRNGELRTLEIAGRKEFGENLQSIFCDDHYLYYLFTQNSNERSDKKKVQEKLILNRFSNDDLSYKRIVLDLPAIASGETTTFWSYAGQKGEEIYLASKQIDRSSSASVFTVSAINSDGKVVRSFTLSLALDGKFLRPAWDDLRLQNNKTNLEFDEYYRTSHAMYSGSHPFTPSTPGQTPIIASSTSTQQKITNGSFGYIRMDQANGHFYVYGLSGPKPFKSIASVYNGFYVAQYDLLGKQLWKTEQPASKALLDESFFRIHGTPAERDITLKILPGGKSIFSIHFKKELFEFELSAEGKVIGTQHQTDVLALTGNIFSDSEKLKSESFIQKNEATKKDKQIFYINALTTSGEIVVRSDIKDSTFDLYYFKN